MSSRIPLAKSKQTTLLMPPVQPTKRLVASPKNSPPKGFNGMVSPSVALLSPRLKFAEISINNSVVRTPDKNLKEAVSPNQHTTPIGTNLACNSFETSVATPLSERGSRITNRTFTMLDMDERSPIANKTFTVDSIETFLNYIGMAKYIGTFEGIDFWDFQKLHRKDLISMGIEEADAIELAKKIKEKYY